MKKAHKGAERHRDKKRARETDRESERHRETQRRREIHTEREGHKEAHTEGDTQREESTAEKELDTDAGGVGDVPETSSKDISMCSPFRILFWIVIPTIGATLVYKYSSMTSPST